ncbi:MAG: ABC transporter ATP-binding protein [Vampirovibrionales bacterium]|nr:ABC transporter ATP-binding protein [Vampirovibrionales bacterium]
MITKIKQSIFEYLNRPPHDKKGNLYGSYSVSQLYLRLYNYISPYKWRVLAAVLITIPIGSLDGLIAYSLKPYVDGLQGTSSSSGNLMYVPIFIVAFTMLQGLLNYFSIYLNGWLGYRIMNSVRFDLFNQLQTNDVQLFDTSNSGWVVSRYYRDPESLQTNLLDNSKQILTRFFSGIFLCGVLLTMSWKLAIIAITIMLCMLYPTTHIRKIIKMVSREMTEAAGNMISFYTETYNGIRVIQGFNHEKHRVSQYQKLQRFVFDRYMKRIKAQGWLTPSMHLIASIGIAVIIWQGSNMVQSKELTAGTFTAFIAALIMLYQPIKNLGGSLLNTQFSLLAASRIFECMDTKPLVADDSGAIKLKSIENSIEFRNVTFSYRENNAVLKQVSFKIKRGEKIALVGKSGSGKSTIANLLPRFYNVNLGGEILIDGKNINQYTLHSLRHNIATVQQENFLFEGTIRQNLLIGNTQATDEDLWKALEQAYLKDFIATLPAGLETPVGERGVLLSGGQRQRVAIARAILKNAPIVILDEATSALDNEAEAIVHKALESLMQERTVIIIAHRLSSIRNADRILVVDNGLIMEEGTHHELMNNGRVYRKLYLIQQGNDNEALDDEQPLMTSTG